jgi:MOSC domain-containing protein YiiM
MEDLPSARVVSVSRDDEHRFSKPTVSSIRLIAGLGIEGDSHAGVTVQHRSRLAHHASEPNLRQVHLIPEELFGELAASGYVVAPGELGENILTRGIDLLALPRGTRLHLGGDAVLEVTGLRNPCTQIDRFQDGLLKEVVGRDTDGNLVRRAGVMSIVRIGGVVCPDDVLVVELPAGPQEQLAPV